MKNQGFTLIEMLLSTGIIVAIIAISTPIFQSFQAKNDLDIAAVTVAQNLRRAQMLSQSIDGDATWGVFVANGSQTIFKGASYAIRDVAFDEIFDMPTSIVPSGISEIVFSKLYGLPQTIGTINFASTTNEIRIVTINAKGTIDY